MATRDDTSDSVTWVNNEYKTIYTFTTNREDPGGTDDPLLGFLYKEKVSSIYLGDTIIKSDDIDAWNLMLGNRANKTFIANDFDNNSAIGQYSAALGKNTLAHGDYSHAGGINTKAYGSESVVFGRNNSAGARGYYLNNVSWDDTRLFLYLGVNFKSYCPISEDPGIVPQDWKDPGYTVNVHITDHYPNFDFQVAAIWSHKLGIVRNNEQVEEFISILQELNGNPAQNASNTRTWSVVNTSKLDSGEVYFGNNSFVSGESNKGWGNHIHIEGARNFAAGEAAHAEGADNSAEGNNSHVEGQGNVSYGNDSHAEGRMTRSEGEASHVGGVGTIAKEEGQTVVGKYNSDDEKALLIVGAGTSDGSRANAFATGKDANGSYITVGGIKLREDILKAIIVAVEIPAEDGCTFSVWGADVTLTSLDTGIAYHIQNDWGPEGAMTKVIPAGEYKFNSSDAGRYDIFVMPDNGDSYNPTNGSFDSMYIENWNNQIINLKKGYTFNIQLH